MQAGTHPGEAVNTVQKCWHREMCFAASDKYIPSVTTAFTKECMV